MKILIFILLLFSSCSYQNARYIVAVDRNHDLKVYKTEDVSLADSIFRQEFGFSPFNDSTSKSLIYYEIRMLDSIQSKGVYYERKR